VTRYLHIFRHRAARIARAAYRWCGPVAGSIRGELSKEERVRAISKAMLFGVTSGTTLLATIKQPDTVTEVVVPLVTAALAGLLDAVFHHQTGAERTEP
jgi:hypothetical protein